MCVQWNDSSLDSNRLSALKRILSQREIDSQIGDQLQTRYCKRITNRQLIWLIVSMGLFAGKSYRQLFRLCNSSSATLPSRATLTNARKRLSADLLGKLQQGIVKLLASSPRKHSFAYYKGLRLMGVDGTLLDCPDTDANRAAFGRVENQVSRGAFPKVRVVSLCELGTRVLWRNIIGTYHQSEQKLVLPLLDLLHSKMLLLADRHFGVATIIYPLFQRKVPFLIRVKKSQCFPLETALQDGSFLSTIYRDKNDRARRRPGTTVRVIRYTHRDPNRPHCGEVHVLVTSLLDAVKYPAAELIELYHVRWEEEIAFSEWKVLMCGSRVLRSQSPEMVRQEIWGMLISHFVVRSVIFEAANRAQLAPARISFTGTLDILHARLPEIPSAGRGVRRWYHRLVAEIAQERLPKRVNRINPRKVKKRGKAWPTKRDSDRSPPKPNGPFATIIQISI